MPGRHARKTTKKEFDYYVKRCKYYIDKFGLGEWAIQYEWYDLCASNIGQVSLNFTARSAIIEFPTHYDGDIKLTKELIDSTALHEVLEIILYPLGKLAERDSSDTNVSTCTHEIIQRITRLVLGNK